MKPFRVVLDTNVLLSALLFRSGRMSWIEPLWIRGPIIPLISKATTEEFIRVLDYPKFRLTPFEKQTILKAFLPHAEAVSVTSTAGCPPCRDPHDVPFLALARQGQADYLVTGDADLLAVSGETPYTILTPDAFRAISEGRKPLNPI